MKKDSVKEMALAALSENDGLKLTEIHKNLISKHQARHSIQATKKALSSLLNEKVVEKKEQKYFVLMDWVLKQKAFLDRIVAEKSRKKYVDIDYNSDYNILFFETLFELDNFWNMVILKIARETKEKQWIAIDNFIWFLIINIGYETSLVSDLKKLGFKCTVGTNRAYPINRWALNIYRNIGVRAVPLSGNRLLKETDINVIGDTILEIRFDKRVFRKIRSIFERFDRIEDIPPKTIAELSTMRGRHEFRIIRSPALAGKIARDYGVELSK